jgi:hypothetical protein
MKKNIYLIALIAIAITTSCKKEKEKTTTTNPVVPTTPKIEWSKNWGGSMNDYGYASVKTPDGGIITAGNAMSFDGDATGQHNTIGTGDMAIIKYNSMGEKQWQKLYGSSGHEEARAIINTSDGGYLVSGSASSNNGDVTGVHGGDDVWVIKINANGELQWQKTFGGFKSDYARSMAATPDGGYVIVGASESINGDLTTNKGSFDLWVLKINGTGVLQWQKSLGSSGIDEARAVSVNADGTIIVAGYVGQKNGDVNELYGGDDVWVIKMTATGDVIWKKNYGGTNNELCIGMVALLDGGFVLCGNTQSTDGDVTSNKGNGDMWLLKIDANGNKVWQKTYGGSGYEVAYTIGATTDGNIVAAGLSYSKDGDIINSKGNNDAWLIKVNSTGTLQWQKSFGGSQNDMANSIQVVSDNTFFITGSTNSIDGDVSGYKGHNDIWVMKIQAK